MPNYRTLPPIYCYMYALRPHVLCLSMPFLVAISHLGTDDSIAILVDPALIAHSAITVGDVSKPGNREGSVPLNLI